MPLRCSQSNADAGCRRSFRPEPGGSRLARRSASAACLSSGESTCSISLGPALIIASIHWLIAGSAACGMHIVHSPARRLAPNFPVRRTDQDGLVGPDVEPNLGLAPTWKAPWRNADLAHLTSGASWIGSHLLGMGKLPYLVRPRALPHRRCPNGGARQRMFVPNTAGRRPILHGPPIAARREAAMNDWTRQRVR